MRVQYGVWSFPIPFLNGLHDVQHRLSTHTLVKAAHQGKALKSGSFSNRVASKPPSRSRRREAGPLDDEAR